MSKSLSGDETLKVYESSDGSVNQRLHAVYNSIKHAEKRINSDQIIPESVSHVWMTNEGIRSTDAQLVWSETGNVLDELAHWADGFQDPSRVREWLANRVSETGSD
jgi:hypothetical protein